MLRQTKIKSMNTTLNGIPKKDKFNEDRKARIDCECGGRFSKNHKARHLQSNIHQEWLNSQTSEA